MFWLWFFPLMFVLLDPIMLGSKVYGRLLKLIEATPSLAEHVRLQRLKVTHTILNSVRITLLIGAVAVLGLILFSAFTADPASAPQNSEPFPWMLYMFGLMLGLFGSKFVFERFTKPAMLRFVTKPGQALPVAV